jgi:hypothetical protein
MAAASGIKVSQPVAAATATEEEPVILLADAALKPRPVAVAVNGRQERARGKKAKKPLILPLVILGSLLAVCGVAIGVVMFWPPQQDVSQRENNGAGRGTALNSQAPSAKPSASENSASSAEPVKSASPKGSSQPVTSGAGKVSATPTHPADVGNLRVWPNDEPQAQPRGSGKPDGRTTSDKGSKPRAGDDPFASPPDFAPKPGPVDPPPEVAKIRTSEELDKLLADAKSVEDYRAIVDDALRAADKAMDDHQSAAARQMLLKALVAARKSDDSKLVFKATRALVKPDSLKQILAEAEQ